MKKTIKIFIFILIFLGVGFLINSRRISAENFKIMVLFDTMIIVENCEKRHNYKIVKKLNYNDSLYNNIVDSYKYENFCNLPLDSIKSTIEKSKKEWAKDNWFYIY